MTVSKRVIRGLYRSDRFRLSMDFAPDSSMTEQQFKDECDINNIVNRPNFGINPMRKPDRQFEFGDFAGEVDFQTAQNIVASACSQFELLPSGLRDRFENSPSKFMEFVNDPKNIDEGIELGIYVGKPEKVTAEQVSTSVVEKSAHVPLDVSVRTDTIQ